MNDFKRILSIWLALALVFTGITFTDKTAKAATTTGTYTDSQGITWSYSTDGVTSITNLIATSLPTTVPTSITIPDYINGLPVTTMANATSTSNALKLGQNTTVTSIIIPDTLNIIGDYAFNNLRGVTSVTLGKNVTRIGSNAFARTRISSITLPDTLIYLGGAAFAYCLNLTEITIPESVTSIGDGAFTNNDKLTSIYYNAINCNNLYNFSPFYQSTVNENGVSGSIIRTYPVTKVVIGDKVTRIPNNLFNNSTINTKTTITLPDSVKSVGDYAFQDCVANIVLNKTLTSIGTYAFSKSGIDDVEIPASVTTLGAYALSLTSKLNTITFDEGFDLNLLSSSYLCYSNVDLTSIYFNSKSVPTLSGTVIKNTFGTVVAGTTVYGYTGTYAKNIAQTLGCNFVSFDSLAVSPSVSIQSKSFNALSPSDISYDVDYGNGDLKANSVIQLSINGSVIDSALWSANGTTITIDKSVFSSLPVGSYRITTVFDDFYDTSLENVKVTVSSTTATAAPTTSPTVSPSTSPSVAPTTSPTAPTTPTISPSTVPTVAPTTSPSTNEQSPSVTNQSKIVNNASVQFGVNLGSGSLAATGFNFLMVGNDIISPSYYSLSGNTVTLSYDYLKTLAVGTYKLSIEFNDSLATDVVDIITLKVPTKTLVGVSPSISTQTETLSGTAISFALDYGSGDLKATGITKILSNGQEISTGAYSVTDNTITFGNAYLNGLSSGTYTFGVVFNDINGTSITDKLMLIVPIKDTGSATSTTNIVYVSGSTQNLKIPLNTSASDITSVKLDDAIWNNYSYDASTHILTIASTDLTSVSIGNHVLLLTLQYGVITQSISKSFLMSLDGGIIARSLGTTFSDSSFGVGLAVVTTGTTGLVYQTTSDGKATVIDYTGEDANVTIPSDINGATVTGIDSLGTSSNVGTVTVPSTVTNIGSGAIGSGTTIIGESGSVAQDYANSNGNAFTQSTSGNGGSSGNTSGSTGGNTGGSTSGSDSSCGGSTGISTGSSEGSTDTNKVVVPGTTEVDTTKESTTLPVPIDNTSKANVTVDSNDVDSLLVDTSTGNVIINNSAFNGLPDGKYTIIISITYGDNTSKDYYVTVAVSGDGSGSGSGNEDTVKTPQFTVTKVVHLGKTYKLNKYSKTTVGDVVSTYKSSNTKVLKVSKNGVVTPVKKGPAIVTCKVIVNNATICYNVKFIVKGKLKTKINKYKEISTISKESNNVYIIFNKNVKKSKYTSIATLNTNKGDKVTYKSSNKKIATVETNGKVKGVKVGSCYITTTINTSDNKVIIFKARVNVVK